MKRWISKSFRIAVAVGLLLAVFESIDMRSLEGRLLLIRPETAAVLCITAVFDRVLMSYKWNLLLRSRGVLISHWQAVRLFYIGNLLGVFTPGAIGADAYRITALSRFGKNKIIMSTVAFEKIVGISVISVFALATLPFSIRYLGSSSQIIMWVILISVTVIIGMVFISFRPAIVEGIAKKIPYLSRINFIGKMRDFYNAYAEYRHYPKTVIVFSSLSFLELIVVIFINYLAARTFGINISLLYFLCVMPLLHILIRLPISFQGIGIQEGLFAYFLIAAGFSAADGLSISILLRIAEALSVFLPACIMMWTNPWRLNPSTNLEEK
jgi:uncharacterized membrane protein YbhN (UPF0104 family)